MFDKRNHKIPALEPTALPDEMLHEVAGGMGRPVFWEELSPEGTIACRPAKAPLTTGAGGTFTVQKNPDGTPITCNPSGEG